MRHLDFHKARYEHRLIVRPGRIVVCDAHDRHASSRKHFDQHCLCLVAEDLDVLQDENERRASLKHGGGSRFEVRRLVAPALLRLACKLLSAPVATAAQKARGRSLALLGRAPHFTALLAAHRRGGRRGCSGGRRVQAVHVHGEEVVEEVWRHLRLANDAEHGLGVKIVSRGFLKAHAYRLCFLFGEVEHLIVVGQQVHEEVTVGDGGHHHRPAKVGVGVFLP
mmetsp:Transcript_24099/g.76962  ORF Transcript_24099/g.76962 Transcript_24099/m.76962 type:complete len:223 (-) Transcript_24099:4-672(-)